MNALVVFQMKMTPAIVGVQYSSCRMAKVTFDLSFLRTRASHSIPKLGNAVGHTFCAACADAVAGDLLSKNRHNIISASIRFSHSPYAGAQPSAHAATIIHVGNTFRDSIYLELEA